MSHFATALIQGASHPVRAPLRSRQRIAAAAILAFGLASCSRTPPNPAPEAPAAPSTPPAVEGWFQDATDRLGLKFVHNPGEGVHFFMPGNVGSGLALFDCDNDGRLDLYLIQNGGPASGSTNELWHQEADGHFTNISAGSGLDVAGYGMGVAIGDVNNDGLPDVLLTEYKTVRLFLNLGGGKFREVPAAESGIDNPLWGASAAFVDYDRDGWLDLAVTNYVELDPKHECKNLTGQLEFCGPKAFPGSVTKLFHNLGAQGKPGVFEDVTDASGFGAVKKPGLAIVCADFDGDGWPDIFIANDGVANCLWMNQRNGTFKEDAYSRGVALNALGQPQANMGIALGDINGSGRFALLVPHLIEETSALWIQQQPGIFQDKSADAKLADPLWHATGFGAVLSDFRNRGMLDIAISNGAIRRNRLKSPDAATIAANGPFWAPYAERNQLLEGDGNAHFTDRSNENDGFCGVPRVARGMAAGDFDNDGGVDLAVSYIGAPARIYHNAAPNRGHWLEIRAIEPKCGGRDAYGAEITVHVGGASWKRWCSPAASYFSSNDPRAHFGLGEKVQADTIEVLWPNGDHESFPGSPADRQLTLRHGEGKVDSAPATH